MKKVILPAITITLLTACVPNRAAAPTAPVLNTPGQVSAQASSREIWNGILKTANLYFSIVDQNKDKKVSLAEMAASNGDADYLKDYFRTVDKNADGFITFTEYAASLAPGKSEQIQAIKNTAGSLFEGMHQGDKKLSLGEVYAGKFKILHNSSLVSNPRSSDEMKKLAFEFADKNKNGTLTKAEFESFYLYVMQNGYWLVAEAQIPGNPPADS